LLRGLDEWYRILRRGRSEELVDRWRELNGLAGKSIRVRVDDRVMEGTAESLLSTGQLVLRTTAGERIELPPERTSLLVDPAATS
jgi:biotin-(acetyl-CoA carboxylase) ligase